MTRKSLRVRIAFSFLILFWCATFACGDIVLEMTPSSTGSIPVGGTIEIQVSLAESGTSILTDDGLLEAAVALSLGTPGVANLTAIDVNAGFDNLSVVANQELIGQVGFGGSAVTGNPIVLGTFTLTGAAPGVTSISLAEPAGGFTDFVSGIGANLDADVFQVLPSSVDVTVVPEPGAFMLLLVLVVGRGIRDYVGRHLTWSFEMPRP